MKFYAEPWSEVLCCTIETHLGDHRLRNFKTENFPFYGCKNNLLPGPLHEKTTIWALTRFDKNQPVQSQKQSRSLKF